MHSTCTHAASWACTAPCAMCCATAALSTVVVTMDSVEKTKGNAISVVCRYAGVAPVAGRTNLSPPPAAANFFKVNPCRDYG